MVISMKFDENKLCDGGCGKRINDLTSVALKDQKCYCDDCYKIAKYKG